MTDVVDGAIETAPFVDAERAARLRSLSRTGCWLRAVRPAQWPKALLVLLAPLLAAELSAADLARAAMAVVLACVAAGGTYLINDAIDVDADRRHPTKRRRPIAAGEIDRRWAVVVGAGLLVAAPALGLLLGASTSLALGAYVVVTMAYSTALKRIPLVDILTIAAGFMIRVLIGCAATSTPASGWFLLAVGAGATMIATGKRRGERGELGADAAAHRRALRTYHDALTSRLLIGAASVVCAALVGWATVGGGGPRLARGWAFGVLAPAFVTVVRFVQLALAGRAARPERLVHDRALQVASMAAVAIFVVGGLLS